jgi:hypothetical protein
MVSTGMVEQPVPLSIPLSTNSEAKVNLAIAQYVLYRSRVTAKFYNACKSLEEKLGSLRNQGDRQDSIQLARSHGVQIPNSLTEICTQFTVTMHEFSRFLETLIDADKSSTENRFAVDVFKKSVSELIKPLRDWMEQNQEKLRLMAEMDNKDIEIMPLPMNEIRDLESALFTRRLTVLHPIMELLSDKKETRHIEPPLKGGRYRDVGVVPLLQTTIAAGMSIAQLAERLVSWDLDPKRIGSLAKRKRREAKRLAEALRTWKRRNCAFPSTENL